MVYEISQKFSRIEMFTNVTRVYAGGVSRIYSQNTPTAIRLSTSLFLNSLMASSGALGAPSSPSRTRILSRTCCAAPSGTCSRGSRRGLCAHC